MSGKDRLTSKDQTGILKDEIQKHGFIKGISRTLTVIRLVEDAVDQVETLEQMLEDHEDDPSPATQLFGNGQARIASQSVQKIKDLYTKE